MANSKYEYVKSFEVKDEILFPTLIVVRVEGRDFQRFSKVHEFAKPNDETALNLMNSCASSVVEEFPDIELSYGYSHEYSFVLKRTTEFYQRRESKIQSVIASFFTSSYVTKWKKFFPHRELKYAPSFRSRVIRCVSIEVLMAYLFWRQSQCHVNNQHDTCLYELIKDGKSEVEAQDFLKGTGKREKHELLFKQFGINYAKLPAMYRQGSCIIKYEVKDDVKYDDDGAPVKRRRSRKAGIIHSKNISCKTFWNQNPDLVKELGSYTEAFGKTKLYYIRSFQAEPNLLLSTWIVIRIDGCHFHKFTEIHGFIKPNDERALDLMNSCAVAVLEEFQDLVFAYGVSDEYSFVLKKDSQLYQRRASDIVTSIVSLFTAVYVMKWKEFLPNKELKYPPFFDGRAVCYPTAKILQDYLAWRQVDCHINNQYNTCFWELVKSGKGKSEAQKQLKGTQTAEKLELLKQFSISDYNSLPAMFRQGSSVFREGSSIGTSQKPVVVRYCNVIEPSFWIDNPCILEDR